MEKDKIEMVLINTKTGERTVLDCCNSINSTTNSSNIKSGCRNVKLNSSSKIIRNMELYLGGKFTWYQKLYLHLDINLRLNFMYLLFKLKLKLKILKKH